MTIGPTLSLSSTAVAPRSFASPKPQPREVALLSSPSEEANLQSLPSRIAMVSPTQVASVQADIGQGEYVEGEVIVKLTPGQVGLFGDFASEYGGELVETFDLPQSVYKSFGGDLIRMKLPAGITTAEAIAAMQNDDRVAYAESNDVLEFLDTPPSTAPNDLDERLWGFENKGQTGGKVGADARVLDAWKVTVGDGSAQGPLIAIIDSGMDLDHPDLVGNLWTNPGEIPGNGIDDDGNGVIDDVHGYDAGDDDGSPDDVVGHGTHVAGTIGAVGNNGIGVTGVNQKARLMPLKIDSNGRITTDGAIRAVLYASKMGADITNNSWGGARLNKATEDAYRVSPALHFAAAGNNGSNTDVSPYYPMGFDIPNMVAVGATDHNDAKASFSNYGKTSVDVTAPGKDILSTKNGGGYHQLSGTSMATPFVTGVAGLVLSAYPEASHEEIKSRLIDGSDKVVGLENASVSGGRVNAAKAVEPRS